MRPARIPTRFAVLLALATTLTGCATLRPATLPQPVPDSAPDLTRWERVLVLTPGSRIRVELDTGGWMRVRYRDADAETLTVINGTRSTVLQRADVKRVRLVSPRAGEFSMWGLGVGSAAGAVLGILVDEGGADTVAFTTPWLGGVGAAAGALLGLTPLETTVYEARACISTHCGEP